MSNPAQGAVGAETMTADWRDLLANPDQVNIEYLKRAPDGGNWHVGSPYSRRQMVAAGHEIERLRAALASHRADSDERTAGSWAEVVKAICSAVCRVDGLDPDELRQEYESEAHGWRDTDPQWTRYAEAVAEVPDATPLPATPAQPAGAVPDSLRALSEDYTRAAEERDRTEKAHNKLFALYIEDHPSVAPEDESAARRAYTDACLEKAEAGQRLIDGCLAFIASHPAGQSTGAGADGKVKGERPPNRPGSDKPCFFVGSTGYDAECKTCGQYTPDYERQDFECPWKGIPAPDSTRTGQGEAIARAAYVRICRHDSKEGWQHAGADFDRREEDGGCYVNALELALAIGSDAAEALAARPAAPEAQGAWLPIETVPKDGTHVIAHDEHYGVCEAVWRRAFDDLAEETFEGLWDLNHSALNEATGWQPMPAPPDSSGQGGR